MIESGGGMLMAKTIDCLPDTMTFHHLRLKATTIVIIATWVPTMIQEFETMIKTEIDMPGHLTTDPPSITHPNIYTALVMVTLALPRLTIGEEEGSPPHAMGHLLPHLGIAPAGTGVHIAQAIGDPLPPIELGVPTAHLITQEEHPSLPYPLLFLLLGGCGVLTALAIITQEEVVHHLTALGVPSLHPPLEGRHHPVVIAALVTHGEVPSVLDIVEDLRHLTTVVVRAPFVGVPHLFLLLGECIALVIDEAQLPLQAGITDVL